MEKLFSVDADNFVEKLNPITQARWEVWTKRRGGCHEDTRCIPLKWAANKVKFEPNETNEFNQIEYHQEYILFANELDDINRKLDSIHGPAKLINAVFIKLLSGCSVPEHQDTPSGRENIFSKTRRYHIPIITNPQVYMKCLDTDYYLEKGNVYELENTKNHGVRNESKMDRIHLVIDRLSYK